MLKEVIDNRSVLPMSLETGECSRSSQEEYLNTFVEKMRTKERRRKDEKSITGFTSSSADSHHYVGRLW